MFCKNVKVFIQDSMGHKYELDVLERAVFLSHNTLKNTSALSGLPLTYKGKKVIVSPCGRCIFCCQERRREWSLRCWLEAQEYDNNQFLTLTYDDKHLPKNGVDNAEISRFIHTLRVYFKREKNHEKIRFYACGDYGTKAFRPHYHALLFNCPPFGDEQKYEKNKQGQQLYKSKTLDKLWGKGSCVIGAVTRQSCDYVARFTLRNYIRSIPENLNKPFQSMSNKNGGLGYAYLMRHMDQLIKDDKIQVTGTIVQKLPYYFERKIKEQIGEERFKKEILEPRRERYIKYITTIMAETGQSEKEVLNELQQKLEKQILHEMEDDKKNGKL